MLRRARTRFEDRRDLGRHGCKGAVGGYLSALLVRVPEIGEVVESHGHRFEIRAVDGTRITELAVLEETTEQRERL
jgi:CBS domain containing-hemolysin-like protein